MTPNQPDPAELNEINRKKVEEQTQAATRERAQNRPAKPAKGVRSSGR